LPTDRIVFVWPPIAAKYNAQAWVPITSYVRGRQFSETEPDTDNALNGAHRLASHLHARGEPYQIREHKYNDDNIHAVMNEYMVFQLKAYHKKPLVCLPFSKWVQSTEFMMTEADLLNRRTANKWHKRVVDELTNRGVLFQIRREKDKDLCAMINGSTPIPQVLNALRAVKECKVFIYDRNHNAASV
jgi:hypothetical protein